MPDASAAPDPGAPAAAGNRSVGIALDLLDAFDSDVELTVAELTRRTKVAKSSVSRTCAYLVQRGYLHRVGPGRYRLGMRLLELGHLVKIRTGLDTTAHEVMTELATQVGCTVHLGVPDGADVLFVERIEPTAHQRYATERWLRSPVHRSSCGKVLAAFLPKVLDARLKAGLPARTGYTIVVPKVLMEELDRVHERGYATNIEETTIGGGSVAVPVHDPRSGEVVAALALVAPAVRLREEERALVTGLRRAAVRLERAIGAGQLVVPASSPS